MASPELLDGGPAEDQKRGDEEAKEVGLTEDPPGKAA